VYRERASTCIPGAIVWQLTTVGEHRVLPDGCTDLLWDGHTVRIAGPDTMAFMTTTTGDTVTGLRFAPGWGPSVYGVPAHALRDQRVPLEELWCSADAGELTEHVASSERPGAALESLASARLKRSDTDSLGGLDALVGALRAGRRVSAAASELGLSARQLQRRSLAAFGYGPKTLARILRLGRALELAREGLDLADVAVRAGYADQSHLANDARALAGATVTQLLVA
jgi:AraC-like DNA-binding protein